MQKLTLIAQIGLLQLVEQEELCYLAFSLCQKQALQVFSLIYV